MTKLTSIRACLLLPLLLFVLGAGAWGQIAPVPRSATPGPVSCQQTQRLVLPANTWTTLASGTGAGVITHLWFAFDSNGTGGEPYNVAIRIAFDGAAVPQVGGVSGFSIDGFLGAGFHDSGHPYRTDIWGQSVLTDGQSISGYNNVVMPFGGGYSVQVNPGATGGELCWSNVETSQAGALAPGSAPPPGYRLYSSFGPTVSVAPSAEQTLLQTTRPTILLGVLHYLTGQSNLTFLEGDQRIYYAGSATAAARWSGSEDFFGSSYYFTDGYVRTNLNGLVYKDGGGNVCAYRFWPLALAPASLSGLKFTWSNGDGPSNPSNVVTQNTASTPLLFYYMK